MEAPELAASWGRESKGVAGDASWDNLKQTGLLGKHRNPTMTFQIPRILSYLETSVITAFLCPFSGKEVIACAWLDEVWAETNWEAGLRHSRINISF